MPEPGYTEEAVLDRYLERIKSGQVHRSPFEAIANHASGTPFYKLHEMMVYNGTVRSAIADLRSALLAPKEGDNYQRIALAPPILVRGIIDWNVAHPHTDIVKSVQDVTAIGLNTYKGDYPTALSLLNRYEEGLGEKTLQSEIHQPDDIASWMGYDPVVTNENAMKLAFHFGERPLLFIALGQGATPSGMDVFLRHTDITENPDSKFYVVRFSRNKKKDERPAMTRAEAEYLQETGKGKQVVLFEEDSVTARTLQMGTDFFRKHVFPNQPVYPLTNYRGSSGAIVY